MLKKSLSALLIILCTVSCRKDILPELSGIPIGFREAEVETKTVGIIDNTNLTTMGLIASYSQTSNFNPNSENGDTPNYMLGQEAHKVTTGTGADAVTNWEYTPLKYWPADPDSKISFFAYAPHFPFTPENGHGITVCPSNTQGYPFITFTVAESPSDQIDLLIAPPALNRIRTQGTVPFAFRHALTKVRFKSEGLNIVSIRATVSYSRGKLSYTESGALWTPISSVESPSFILTTENKDFYFVEDSNEGYSTDKGTLMMIPQNGILSITIICKTFTEPFEDMESSSSIDIDWKMGESVLYKLINHNNHLIVTPEIDDEWIWHEHTYNEESVGGL